MALPSTSIVQYSTVQYITVEYSKLQFSTLHISIPSSSAVRLTTCHSLRTVTGTSALQVVCK